jgi:hypothetical protein
MTDETAWEKAVKADRMTPSERVLASFAHKAFLPGVQAAGNRHVLDGRQRRHQWRAQTMKNTSSTKAGAVQYLQGMIRADLALRGAREPVLR